MRPRSIPPENTNMERNLTIYYTSDIHGCFSPVNYATGEKTDSGLANCLSQFHKDGNTLIIDGGDTLQGTPLTYFLSHEEKDVSSLPAKLLNLGGYDFITLGNHDFDYGKAVIERYLAALDAVCLCANVEGICGVQKTAVVTLENGLRVGLTGIITPFVAQFEPAETMAGITVNDAFAAAWTALSELRRAKVDVTICIYHGGFEADVMTGKVLSQTGENQGWRICRELGFDVLLAAHQHMPLDNLQIGGTYTCQPPDKASKFICMDVTADRGSVKAVSKLLPAGETPLPAALELLRPVEQKLNAWLDRPVGTLDVPLFGGKPLELALHGSLLANLFNQVQLEATGADISVTSLSNQVLDFPQHVTNRAIVSAYAFPNTLKTIRVVRSILKTALERDLSYFDHAPDGSVCVSREYLEPIVQHFNFDYYLGLTVTADLKKPIGERVISIVFAGEELPEDKALTLCLNNYRASGAGGYGCYKAAPLLSEGRTEMQALLLQYVEQHKTITVDKSRWLTIIS